MYVRDGIKQEYQKKKKNECYICGDTINLEVHHLFSLSVLFDEWLKEKFIPKKSIVFLEQIKSLRSQFYVDKKKELDSVITLCQSHHDKLEYYFGKKPRLSKVDAMSRYIMNERKKHVNWQ